MASERIAAAGIGGSYAVTQLLTSLRERMQSESLKQSATRFFRQHDVSIHTHIQAPTAFSRPGPPAPLSRISSST